MRIQFAAVVVLYNPELDKVLDNIKSYVNSVDFLYVVDNSESEESFEELIRKYFGKVTYVKNSFNLGIAKALNIGAELAIKANCKWLLTMDQDSKATPGMIEAMTIAIDKYARVGIISPVHTGEEIKDLIQKQQEFLEVDSVMTSGNLLNLEAYKQVGPFNERLFIDYVDHEYCLRLKKSNFKILIATKASLTHNLGNISVHKIGNTTNHNVLRRYYMTRNRLLVQRDYKNDFPTFCKQDKAKMWKELVKICLLEKNKIKKIRAFILGYYHFKINKFGKLN